jgi:hypothetical protein
MDTQWKTKLGATGWEPHTDYEPQVFGRGMEPRMSTPEREERIVAYGRYGLVEIRLSR